MASRLTEKKVGISTVLLQVKQKLYYFCRGEMAEWSNAAVLKTVEGHTSGGSNPSLSAKCTRNPR